jgi:nucleoid-associated protein YgaU
MFVRIILVAFVTMALAWSVLVRTSDGAGRPQAYVVRPGDTLWSIAASRYGGDTREGVWKIERLNGLHGAGLVPGQRLLVP